MLAVPHSGDMAENAARLDWAGVGVRLPWRFLSPATLRLAVRRALAEPRRCRAGARAGRVGGGPRRPDRAAELVEELVATGDRRR